LPANKTAALAALVELFEKSVSARIVFMMFNVIDFVYTNVCIIRAAANDRNHRKY
jgi:hypothetical protein